LEISFAAPQKGDDGTRYAEIGAPSRGIACGLPSSSIAT
jgi:hypothetical protein